MRPCSPALVALLVLSDLSGCSGPTKGSGDKRPVAIPLAADVALLTVPPGRKTLEALDRIATRAQGGDADAAWARAHYLLDLFDDARYRKAPASLEVLASALRSKADELAGSSGTNSAIAALMVSVDNVLAAERLHRDAQAARTLLEADQKPAAARPDVFRQMSLLKAVARGGSALAPNARLRLVGYCRTALGDIVRARWAERMRIMAHCLYPLFDADPEPYFSADVAARPPPISSIVIMATAKQLLLPRTAGNGRLDKAAAAMAAELPRLLRSTQLPVALDPTALSLPQVVYATPYDWSPILRLGDGSKPAPVAKLVQDMARLVQGDGRSTLAVTMLPQAPGTSIVHAANVARGTGAIRLELLVSFDQQLALPAGDYWSGRAEKNRVRRAAVIPLSLVPMMPIKLRPQGPRQRWDTTRATLQLHLSIERTRWRLFGPTGDIANIQVRGGTPAADLRAALARVRAAFDFENALVLVVASDVTYGAVVTAADAANRDASGSASFTQLGLATTAPSIKSKELVRRIERRRHAKVAVIPAELGRQQQLLRRCYQERLDDNQRLTGTVRVELRGDAIAVVGGPSDRGLRRCVVQSLEVPMVKEKIASAEVTVSPK